MGKGGAEGPFLARVVVKHLLCPFHHQAQVLHRPRMKRLQKQRGWVKTYSRRDGEASASLQHCPVKVRPTLHVLSSLVAKIPSKQASGTYLLTWQMCSHLGRCANSS